MINALRNFLRTEAASGGLLVISTAAAMATANSPLAPWYDKLLGLPLEIRLGDLVLAKPLLLWINDGLMALFFLVAGLEIKREILEGELSEPSRVALPALAAVGGMAAPALIFAAFNRGDAVALQGWAIPTATDIAFALGVLSLVGERVPASLKLFLLTLAILDDLGAIVIIALFYTANLSALSLAAATAALAALVIINRRGVTRVSAYILVGVVLWLAVLKSGVHATLAGVALAFCIPLRVQPGADEDAEPPLRRLEADLHPPVAYAILPIFAFANAGVDLSGLGAAMLGHGVTLGVALGLALGKPIGVLGASALAVWLRIASLPAGASWVHMLGVGMLCGVGFTMSLFVGSLAYEHTELRAVVDERLGILIGSFASAVLGYGVLRFASRG